MLELYNYFTGFWGSGSDDDLSNLSNSRGRTITANGISADIMIKLETVKKKIEDLTDSIKRLKNEIADNKKSRRVYEYKVSQGDEALKALEEQAKPCGLFRRICCCFKKTLPSSDILNEVISHTKDARDEAQRAVDRLKGTIQKLEEQREGKKTECHRYMKLETALDDLLYEEKDRQESALARIAAQYKEIFPSQVHKPAQQPKQKPAPVPPAPSKPVNNRRPSSVSNSPRGASKPLPPRRAHVSTTDDGLGLGALFGDSQPAASHDHSRQPHFSFADELRQFAYPGFAPFYQEEPPTQHQHYGHYGYPHGHLDPSHLAGPQPATQHHGQQVPKQRKKPGPVRVQREESPQRFVSHDRRRERSSTAAPEEVVTQGAIQMLATEFERMLEEALYTKDRRGRVVPNKEWMRNPNLPAEIFENSFQGELADYKRKIFRNLSVNTQGILRTAGLKL